MKIDLGTQHGYDIATAIRGPDFATVSGTAISAAAFNLKEALTGRVRFLALGWARCSGMINPNSAKTIYIFGLEQCVRALRYDRQYELIHYLKHVLAATVALQEIGGEMQDAIDEAAILEDVVRRLLSTAEIKN